MGNPFELLFKSDRLIIHHHQMSSMMGKPQYRFLSLSLLGGDDLTVWRTADLVQHSMNLRHGCQAGFDSIPVVRRSTNGDVNDMAVPPAIRKMYRWIFLYI